MGKRIRLAAIGLLTMGLLAALFPATVNASAMFTAFSGEAVKTETTDPGTVRALGDSRMLLAGVVEDYSITASDPRVTGQATVTSSGILDISFSGRIWGTFQLENELGGWYGHITGAVEGGNMYIRLIASGVGGLDGLKSSWDLEGSLFSSEMSFKGRILEH